MPTVSVIVPNYNHERFLTQRLESILNQTFQDFEIIILDDFSKDNSKEIIERYRANPKITNIIYNNENSGSAYKQWKKGIVLAKGDYIWIAESDDYADPVFLEALLKPFTTNPNLGISFSNSNWVDDQGALGKSLSLYIHSFEKTGKQEIKEMLLKYNTIQNASSVLIKKKFALNALKDLSKFKSCGDWFLYINILKFSDLNYNNKTLNNFRWYHNNISNNAFSKGFWIEEGTTILRMINPDTFSLAPNEVKDIYRYWRHKISAQGFSLLSLQKIHSLINLFIFYIKFSLR